MTRLAPYPHIDIDLTNCERGDPCHHGFMCRIHQMRAFFADLGWVEAKPSPLAQGLLDAAKGRVVVG